MSCIKYFRGGRDTTSGLRTDRRDVDSFLFWKVVSGTLNYFAAKRALRALSTDIHNLKKSDIYLFKEGFFHQIPQHGSEQTEIMRKSSQ